MSTGFSLFIIIGTLASIAASFWLIVWSGNQGPELTQSDTGHEWDGLRESNNPLPRWWLWLFVITLIWGAGYLIWYPGLGNFGGTSGWTQYTQYDAEVEAAEAKYGPLFAQYASLPHDELVKNEEALAVGRSLFANYCSQCHGSAGYGAASFPNLADNDWLYGNSLETIEYTILNGRNGIMPALGSVFADDAALDEMVAYVRDMSAGQDTSSPAHQQYLTVCSACHGATGDGNQALGAPRLNDDIWLYGSNPKVVADIISNGRQNRMPAHKQLVGEDRARLTAAYVLSLSQGDGGGQAGD